MSARKKTPCPFCDEEEFAHLEAGPNADATVEIYPFNGHIAVIVQGVSDDGEMTGEDEYSIEMNYCPVCGRKLDW